MLLVMLSTLEASASPEGEVASCPEPPAEAAGRWHPAEAPGRLRRSPPEAPGRRWRPPVATLAMLIANLAISGG